MHFPLPPLPPPSFSLINPWKTRFFTPLPPLATPCHPLPPPQNHILTDSPGPGPRWFFFRYVARPGSPPGVDRRVAPATILAQVEACQSGAGKVENSAQKAKNSGEKVKKGEKRRKTGCESA